MSIKRCREVAVLVGFGIAVATQAAVAAQQRGHAPLSLDAPTENPEDFPLPPIPPDTPPAESAAPVPGSAAAPTPDGNPAGAQLSPGFFHDGIYGSGGNGYLAGGLVKVIVTGLPPT